MNALRFVEVAELHVFGRITGVVGRDHLIQAVDNSVDYLIWVNESINVLQDTVSTHAHARAHMHAHTCMHTHARTHTDGLFFNESSF